MDLKNIVSQTQENNSPSPEFKPRVPSLSDLVNPPSSSENNNNNSNSNRPSISSLTNDNDVDVAGNVTPSIARKVSYQSMDHLLSSDNADESPAPVRSHPSLADVLNAAANAADDANDDIEEPTYEEDKAKLKAAANEKKKEEEEEEVKEQLSSELKRPLSEISPGNETQQEQKKPHLEEPKPSSDPNKPKRYDTPPIWAETWIPKNLKPRRFHSNVPANASNVAAKKDTNVSSLGGMYSIKGVRPYNDIGRRISSWIYVNLSNTRPEDRENLELEIKLGRIINPKTAKRVVIPVVSECVLAEDFAVNSRFEAGLDEHEWIKLKKYVSDMMKLDKKKFRSVQSETIDKQFREASSGKMPRLYRVSYDLKTGRVVDVIEKKRIASLFIHCPDLACDLRLSLSLESPHPKELADKYQDRAPESSRTKKRLSIDHDLTNTKFDITEVTQKERNKDELKLYEFELEVHMRVLLGAYQALLADNDNNIPFQEVPDILMDNARILNRFLSQG